MTARERVMGVLKMPWRPDPDPYAPGRREFLLHEELEQRLEQAINAAVEEEREACAIVIDLEGQRYAERGGSVTRTVAGILSNLAAKIRARSNPAE